MFTGSGAPQAIPRTAMYFRPVAVLLFMVFLCPLLLTGASRTAEALTEVDVADGVYSEWNPREPKCFVEELAPETHMLGQYLALPQPHTGNERSRPQIVGSVSDTSSTGTLRRLEAEMKTTAVRVTVLRRDPHTAETKTIFDKNLKHRDRFAFSSSSKTESSDRIFEYEICFHAEKFRNELSYRLYVELHAGEETVDYEALAQAENLSDLQTELSRIHYLLQDVKANQALLQSREDEFLKITANINSRIVIYSLVMLLTVVVAAVVQHRMLRAVFAKRKML